MKKKKYSHSVSMRTTVSSRKGSRQKMKSKNHSGDKKSMEEIYNKFYRDQVNALYRAVRGL